LQWTCRCLISCLLFLLQPFYVDFRARLMSFIDKLKLIMKVENKPSLPR
jgi:hypothetical protein